MSATTSIVSALKTQVQMIVIPWTSNGSGAYTESIGLTGFLMQVEFVPSGTAAPTDLYDITMPNANGFDVLAGTGANLSTSTPSRKSPCATASDGTNSGLIPIFVSGTHTFTVANAGAGKSGTVTLWLK